MRLMSYNILDGAVNTLSQIIESVNQIRPDYLTLNEANTFVKDDNNILKTFADATHFPYFAIALSGQDDYHVAVLSKFPLKHVHIVENLARGCIITLINTPIGELSIAGMHLAPFSEEARLPEISKILQFQKQCNKSILLGDMNSLARSDNYNPDIIQGFNGLQMKKFTKNNRLCFDVTDMILSAGYEDSAVTCNKNPDFTVPTPANRDKTHSSMRLDYIFISRSLHSQLKSYEVVKNRLTDRASDHYPVVANLE